MFVGGIERDNWHEKVMKNLTKFLSNPIDSNQPRIYHLFSIKRFLKVTFLEISLTTSARKQE